MLFFFTFHFSLFTFHFSFRFTVALIIFAVFKEKVRVVHCHL